MWRKCEGVKIKTEGGRERERERGLERVRETGTAEAARRRKWTEASGCGSQPAALLRLLRGEVVLCLLSAVKRDRAEGEQGQQVKD